MTSNPSPPLPKKDKSLSTGETKSVTENQNTEVWHNFPDKVDFMYSIR